MNQPPINVLADSDRVWWLPDSEREGVGQYMVTRGDTSPNPRAVWLGRIGTGIWTSIHLGFFIDAR